MSLWRVEEAAEFLGIRPKTLYEWVRQGRVPYRKIGFNVRFDPSELESWVGAQSRGPDPGEEVESRPAVSERSSLERGVTMTAPASGIRSEMQDLMGEVAVTLRDLEHEVGAELSFTRRQQLRALAERLETAVRDLGNAE